MILNMTMLIQMFHFMLAYVILDYIFLRVAVAHIRAEDRKVSLLEQQIQEQQARIGERTQQNEQNWFILKKRLQTECPEHRVGIFLQGAEVPSLVQVACPTAEVERESDRLQHAIIKAITHDTSC